MDNSNETDVHSMATKALAEALPKIQDIINGSDSGPTVTANKLQAATLLKEIYEATSGRQTSVADELKKLNQLQGQGSLLSDEEYNKQKMKLLM